MGIINQSNRLNLSNKSNQRFMKKHDPIFIAGSAGMVGSAIIRKLLSLGYTNLIGSFHTRPPDAAMFSGGTEKAIPEGLKLVPVDLTQQTAVTQFFKEEKPAHVFLAAARVGGIHANNSYPAWFIRDNLVIQNNIIHAAYLSGVERLLFLGSSCIYPKLAPQPMQENHLLTGLLEPTNEPYAIAKIAGIKMCEAYNRQYGTRFMAVMPTNLYGTNDNFDLENSHVLPALIRKFHLAALAAKGDWAGIEQDETRSGPIPNDIKRSLGLPQHSAPDTDHSLFTAHRPPSVVTLWGTGTPKREFLHVDDMADASVFVMNIDDRIVDEHLLSYPAPCFVNVGTGTDITIRELAEFVRGAVGFKGKIKFDTSKPDGTLQKLLDVSRLAALGWRASISLTDGIDQTYQWYKNRSK
jgi:GDP-L-fucose synthase